MSQESHDRAGSQGGDSAMAEDDEPSFTFHARYDQRIRLNMPDTSVLAEYDPVTGTVTFDWFAIEAEAIRTNGMARGLARILLAAREAGRAT